MTRGEWNHPGDLDEKHVESFFDLYEEALEATIKVVNVVGEALDGEGDLGILEDLVGNQNLSDGRRNKARRKLQFVKPLPLPEVLEAIYVLFRDTEGR